NKDCGRGACYEGDWNKLSEQQRVSIWMESLLGGAGVHAKNWNSMSLADQAKLFQANQGKIHDAACESARNAWVCRNKKTLTTLVVATAVGSLTFGAGAVAVTGAATVGAGIAGLGVGSSLALGGLSGAASSVASQVVATGKVNPMAVVRDAAIGAATAGVLTGAGRAISAIRSARGASAAAEGASAA